MHRGDGDVGYFAATGCHLHSWLRSWRAAVLLDVHGDDHWRMAMADRLRPWLRRSRSSRRAAGSCTAVRDRDCCNLASSSLAAVDDTQPRHGVAPARRTRVARRRDRSLGHCVGRWVRRDFGQAPPVRSPRWTQWASPPLLGSFGATSERATRVPVARERRSAGRERGQRGNGPRGESAACAHDARRRAGDPSLRLLRSLRSRGDGAVLESDLEASGPSVGDAECDGDAAFRPPLTVGTALRARELVVGAGGTEDELAPTLPWP